MDRATLSDSPHLSTPGARARYRLRAIRPADLARSEIEAWHDLEAVALEPNIYMSPIFLVPAFRHLAHDRQPEILFLESRGARTLVAVVVIEPRSPSREMPLSHFRAFHTVHSFIGGVLVSRDRSFEVLSALLAELMTLRGHGIAFPLTRTDGPTDLLMRQVAKSFGLNRIEKDCYQRAAMTPRSLGAEYISTRLSNRGKKLAAQQKRLAELGKVEFAIKRGAQIDDATIERHLDLEHMGWKGEAGTSLRSNAAHETFFREMTKDFVEAGRALFTELSVGGRVIASTSNFVSGRKGFAFKVGFDPEFKKFSPGINCEMELMRRAPDCLHDIDEFDSGAAAGSYIEELWPERHSIGTAVYATTRRGNVATETARRISGLYARWRSLSPAPALATLAPDIVDGVAASTKILGA